MAQRTAPTARTARTQRTQRTARDPVLILLNGPPGVGKSTLAERYAREHPLTLDLDVDRLRRQIGGWADHEAESGRLARRGAGALARLHLAEGYDVVVPQFVARPEFAERLEALADAGGARFTEVALMVPVEVALRRFAARSAAGRDAVHLEAARMVERAGGEKQLAAMYAALTGYLDGRPRTVVLDVAGDDVDAAHARLVASLRA